MMWFSSCSTSSGRSRMLAEAQVTSRACCLSSLAVLASCAEVAQPPTSPSVIVVSESGEIGPDGRATGPITTPHLNVVFGPGGQGCLVLRHASANIPIRLYSPGLYIGIG